MSSRILLAAALVLSCGPALVAVPKAAAGPKVAATKVRPALPKQPVPPLQLYVVKGARSRPYPAVLLRPAGRQSDSGRSHGNDAARKTRHCAGGTDGGERMRL